MSAKKIALVIPMCREVPFSLARRGFRIAEFVVPIPADADTMTTRIFLEVPAEATPEEIAECLETGARALRKYGA